MKKIVIWCVILMVSVSILSGCEILSTQDAQVIKEVAGGALTAAKAAAIDAGLAWTATNIAAAAGGTTGIGGLSAFAVMTYRAMRRKSELLRVTGAAVEEFASADPHAGSTLKNVLAKSASKLPINAEKEFGIEVARQPKWPRKAV